MPVVSLRGCCRISCRVGVVAATIRVRAAFAAHVACQALVAHCGYRPGVRLASHQGSSLQPTRWWRGPCAALRPTRLPSGAVFLSAGSGPAPCSCMLHRLSPLSPVIGSVVFQWWSIRRRSLHAGALDVGPMTLLLDQHGESACEHSSRSRLAPQNDVVAHQLLDAPEATVRAPLGD